MNKTTDEKRLEKIFLYQWVDEQNGQMGSVGLSDIRFLLDQLDRANKRCEVLREALETLSTFTPSTDVMFISTEMRLFARDVLKLTEEI